MLVFPMYQEFLWSKKIEMKKLKTYLKKYSFYSEYPIEDLNFTFYIYSQIYRKDII